MASLTFMEVCETILIFIRGCLFFYHGISMQKIPKNQEDLLCWMGMYSFAGDAIFHFTLVNWPTSQEQESSQESSQTNIRQEWSSCQKFLWSLHEGLIVIGIIVFSGIGIAYNGCCTEECTALFLTDIAFLISFAIVLPVNALPFLRTRRVPDQDAYVVLDN